MTAPREPVPRVARSSLRVGGVCACVGAVVCIAGIAVEPRRTAVAYLTAYVAVVMLALGALAMVMIAELTAATWFVLLRRLAERVVATLPALVVLGIPVLVAIPLLYPWVPPLGGLEAEVRRRVLAKQSYLNVPFFVIRTLIYWGCWVLFGELLLRASRRRDATPGRAADQRMRSLSAGGLVVLAITLSFAAIDWVMSLTPSWYSTVYGVYLYAGGQVAALALLAVMGEWERRNELRGLVGEGHLAALARLLLTFILFWVYIGFSQLIVIWSADIPVEAAWYLPRMRGSWRPLSGILIFGHFAIPFLLLIIHRVRASSVALATLGAWLLVMHYLDAYWLVVPSAGAHVAGWWIDGGAILLVGGATLAFGAWRARGLALVPSGDPALEASLQYPAS